MRRLFGISACLGVLGLSLALAETPPSPAPAASASSSTPPAPPATSAAPAPAGSPAAAAVTAKATPSAAAAPQEAETVAAQERRLYAQGFRPAMRNGEKVYCRTEGSTGSRLGEKKVCGTLAQLQAQEQTSTDFLQRMNRLSRPTSATKPGAQ